jgi:hypothetical protein
MKLIGLRVTPVSSADLAAGDDLVYEVRST